MKYFDRYSRFRDEGTIPMLPFVPILMSDSDIYIKYDKSKMRLDSLSYKYYGDPNFGWLILQANPELGGYEYLIKDGADVRIPYPIDSAKYRYDLMVSSYIAMNN